MQLALTTIASLGAQGNSKAAVVKALFATKNYDGAIGTYAFDANGDTTLKAFGLYKVGPDGNTLFYQDRQVLAANQSGAGLLQRPRSAVRVAGGSMEARSLPSRTASSASRKVLFDLRRAAGKWGLVALLLAFPIYFARTISLSATLGFVHGHLTRIHDLTYLGSRTWSTASRTA